jgi:hypothetical protein
MMQTKVAVAALICAGLIASASIIAYSNLHTQRSVSVTVALKSVEIGIYSDLGCSKPLVSIQWGVVEPGSKREPYPESGDFQLEPSGCLEVHQLRLELHRLSSFPEPDYSRSPASGRLCERDRSNGFQFHDHLFGDGLV